MSNIGNRETDDDRGAAAEPPGGKHICVYLGGNLGREQRYIDEADALGRMMAAEGIGLVYGGARVGLMGVLAGAVLANGGVVTGVVPRQLSYQELAHEGLSRLLEVDTMHERKHLMQELSQGCIALPGGFGTLEEIFEALCWSQRPLELHEKPCVFANIDGYYDHLFEFLDHAAARGLLLPQNRLLARQAPSAAGALKAIQAAWEEEEQAILDAIKAYEA
ncbi:MAG: TIGR00730 family Rossman fold protein [Acidobacteria bacterium]|nr:TIGR00730 family Rossman fold protein [Acidobacteriota bacterium]